MQKKPCKQLDPNVDSLSSSLTSCLSSGDKMSSSSRKDSSLKIIVLTDQDEEDESLSSHDDVIQCWQNPSPTQVESDEDEDEDKDDSSIEFIDNKKIYLTKLAKEKKIFSPKILDSIQKFLKAKKNLEEIQNSKELFEDYDDDYDKEEEKILKSLPELNEKDEHEKLDFYACYPNEKTDGMVTIPSIKTPNMLNDFLPDAFENSTMNQNEKMVTINLSPPTKSILFVYI